MVVFRSKMVGTNPLEDGSGGKKIEPVKETLESIEAVLADLLIKKDDELRILRPFLAKQAFARSDVLRLRSVTQAYDSIIDLADQLVATHNKWEKLMEKESKEIESSAQYKPEVFDIILNSLGKL